MRKLMIGIVLIPVVLNVWPAHAQNRPDVLFIAIDDLNDWVGVLGGNAQTKTPHIDALAARGMVFTNAHAAATSCLPSRTALLTGVSPFVSGIYDQSFDWRDEPRLEGLATLPRHFRDNGYDTRGAGKIFHAHTYGGAAGFEGQQDVAAWNAFYPSLTRQLPDEVRPPRPPDPRPSPAATRSTDEPPARPGPRRRWGNFDWQPVVVEDFAMGDGQVVRWVEEQLLASSDGPRFIAAGIYRPHLPWYVPPKYVDMHPLDSIELPPVMPGDLDDVPDAAPNLLRVRELHRWILENADERVWQQAIQGYLSSISFADAMVGKLVEALDRSGRADDTIIVLWSDHGFHLGEKERWRKMTVWEESTRVPLIVVAPGITQAGTRSDEAVSLLDVYPTLTELAGLPTPAHVNGRSLVPLLENPDRQWDGEALSVYGFGNFSVRDDRYRYIVYEDGSEELYDHAADPHEWHNLAGGPEYASIKRRLAAAVPEDKAVPAGEDDQD